MNGTSKTLTFVGSIVFGVLGIVTIVYNLVYAPLNNALIAHCAEAKAEITNIRKEYTDRDSLIIKEIGQELKSEFKEINKSISVLQTDINWLKKEMAK